MKKIIFCLIIWLVFCGCSEAGTVGTSKRYVTGDQVTASNLNGNYDLIRNELNGGLDNNNADTTNGFRFTEVLDTLPAAGNEGRIVYAKDDDTLAFDDGSTFLLSPALSRNNTWTGTNVFSGDVTISATLTVTTADINGGNIDGTIIGDAVAVSASFTSVHLEEKTTGAQVPVPAANTGVIFASDVSATTELFYRDNDQSIVQLTNAGNPNTGLVLISTTPFAAATTQEIAILPNKLYSLIIDGIMGGTDGAMGIRVGDSGGVESDSEYDFSIAQVNFSSTSAEVFDGGSAADNIRLINSTDLMESNDGFFGKFEISTFQRERLNGTTSFFMTGNIIFSSATTGTDVSSSVSGQYSKAITITTLQIFTGQNLAASGNMYLYEYLQ